MSSSNTVKKFSDSDFKVPAPPDPNRLPLFNKIPLDVVVNIFSRLEDDPRHLARLSCVCQRFLHVVKDICWKRRCISIVPNIVAELLQNPQAGEPPGGWASLLKILVCCPGLKHAGVLLDCSDFGLDRELGSSDEYELVLRRDGGKNKRHARRGGEECPGDTMARREESLGPIEHAYTLSSNRNWKDKSVDGYRIGCKYQSSSAGITKVAQPQSVDVGPEKPSHETIISPRSDNGSETQTKGNGAGDLTEVDVVGSQRGKETTAVTLVDIKDLCGKRKERELEAIKRKEVKVPSLRMLIAEEVLGGLRRSDEIRYGHDERLNAFSAIKFAGTKFWVPPMEPEQCSRACNGFQSQMVGRTVFGCLPAGEIEAQRVSSHLAAGVRSLSREQGNKLLASRFRADSLYICDWPGCVHPGEKRKYKLFRGIFKNFKSTTIWRNLQDMKARETDVECAYCSLTSTWDMVTTFCLRRSFEYHDDGEPVVRAYVCRNGHVAGAWTDRPMYAL